MRQAPSTIINFTILIPLFLLLLGSSSVNKSTQEFIFSDTSECEQLFWDKVYNPTRLQVIERCISVTGVVEETGANSDGDQHMLLRLDPGQEKLLNRKNIKNKKGRLVLEIVCANPVLEKKVGNTCNGFTNPIPIPRVGERIKAWGSYVIDTHNGWAEIHPVTKILSL